MSTYSANSDKSTESPKKADWHNCGTYEAGPNSGNSPDGINGSLSIKKSDREALGIEQGDEVLVRANANGNTVIRSRKIVAGGRQVTLPVEARRELNLAIGDVIEFSILPVESKSQNEDERKYKDQEVEEEPVNEGKQEDNPDEASSENRQQKLVGESTVEVPYVLVRGENTDPWTYHRIEPEDSKETVCGIDFSDQNHRTLSEPSDFEPCPFCTAPSSDKSAAEKQQWLGQITGFDVNEDSTATYIKNSQYDAIIEYILSLRNEVAVSEE